MYIYLNVCKQMTDVNLFKNEFINKLFTYASEYLKPFNSAQITWARAH